MTQSRTPRRTIRSIAPIRIADNGGWTDTWFAGYGRVCNIAVHPCVNVLLDAFPQESDAERIVIEAENFGRRIVLDHVGPPWGDHPLLEASLAFMDIQGGLGLRIRIHSDVPPGASTGTSAAVVVALLGALDRLTGRGMAPMEVAAAAHHVEVAMVGLQSGIQDQICSAFGGINHIEMHRFPEARVTRLDLPLNVRGELEDRLVLIYLGSAHSSSDTHRMVIQCLERAGPEEPVLRQLRDAADSARDALLAGDIEAYGRSLVYNTDAQRRLHPDLISPDHTCVIDIARAHGASGWKVNGAGGSGGSVTILSSADAGLKQKMLADIAARSPSYRQIPIRLCPHGVRVVDEGQEG